jgi:hypothetical protein
MEETRTEKISVNLTPSVLARRQEYTALTQENLGDGRKGR